MNEVREQEDAATKETERTRETKESVVRRGR